MQARSITPSSTDLDSAACALVVDSAGDVASTTDDNVSFVAKSVAVGLRNQTFRVVKSSGTTASGFHVLSSFDRSGLTCTSFSPSTLTGWTSELAALGISYTLYRSEIGTYRLTEKIRDYLPHSTSDDWLDEAIWPSVYVDPILGSDSYDGSQPVFTGGTSGPFKSIKKALTFSYGASDTRDTRRKVVIPDGSFVGISTATNSAIPWSDRTGATSLKVNTIVVPTSFVQTKGQLIRAPWTSSMALVDTLAWVQDTSHTTVYSVVLTAAQVLAIGVTTASGVVFNEGQLDRAGLPQRYDTLQTGESITATPARFEVTTSGGISTLRVNTGSSDPLSSLTLKVYCQFTNGSLNVQKDLYVVGGIFDGGTVPFSAAPGATVKAMFGECLFQYSGKVRAAFRAESPMTLTMLYSQCRGAGTDGFSYDGAGGRINFLEVGCVAYGNGCYCNERLAGNDLLTSYNFNRNQGFTVHKDCAGIRVACVAWQNGGPNYQDTNAGATSTSQVSQVVLLGNYGFDSAGTLSLESGSTLATDPGPADFALGSKDDTDYQLKVWWIDSKTWSPTGLSSISQRLYYTKSKRITSPLSSSMIYANGMPWQPTNPIGWDGTQAGTAQFTNVTL